MGGRTPGGEDRALMREPHWQEEAGRPDWAASAGEEERGEGCGAWKPSVAAAGCEELDSSQVRASSLALPGSNAVQVAV